MLLKNQWVIEEIRKYLRQMKMETQLFKILEAKAVLRGKFIAIHTYPPKQEKTQINNLIYYLNK